MTHKAAFIVSVNLLYKLDEGYLLKRSRVSRSHAIHYKHTLFQLIDFSASTSVFSYTVNSEIHISLRKCIKVHSAKLRIRLTYC